MFQVFVCGERDRGVCPLIVLYRKHTVISVKGVGYSLQLQLN